MKKNILLFLIFTLFLACSPRKNGYVNRQYQSFTTFYNVLFNGEDALNTELKQREKSHRDNFYAPYIKLLTYDEQISSSEMENLGMQDSDDMSPPPGFYNDDVPSNFISNSSSSGVSALKISEIKAEKAIQKHSMVFGGVEKNKEIFNAYMLLAKARLFQNQPLEALDALNTLQKVFKKDKRLPLAKIYEGFAYAKMKDFYRADETFRALKEDKKLSKSNKKLLSVFYSEMLLNSGKKEEAVAELENAYKLNKNKELRSRIAFLRGQILANLGENEKARESFVTAYKNAGNFEFEVKSQIEIAKTFNGNADDYEGAKQYLEKISKKGTYASRKNEFYYALGLMANKAGKKDEAQEFFRKSIKEKISDSQIRGLTYYEIGKKFFDDNDYLSAGVYYDSAYVAMNYPPVKEKLKAQTSNIKQVSKNYYLIKKNDSILALTKMTNDEKIAFFNKHIETLKTKEAQEEIERKKAEKEKNSKSESVDFALLANSNDTSSFMDFNAGKSFYFANQSTIAKGENNFKQIWGNRALTDNWRTSAKMNSIEDLKNEALGVSSAPNPRRFETDFYIEKIPTKSEEILALKKDRDTASLGLGRMYENYFQNTALATKTLYNLVDSKPDEETDLQALYQIFSMNYEKNPADAERAKQLILERYPYTSYAEFVKNPKKEQLTTSDAEVQKLYEEAFKLYSEEKFEDSKKLIDNALQKYPKDLLVPKFTLLQAFNTGKTAGKEIMILQLEQLMLNYGKTPEGIKAAEMLKNLKSDLKIEQFDANGNPINNTLNKPKTEIQNPETQRGNSLENSSSPKNQNTPPAKSESNWESNDPGPQPLIPVEPKKNR
jgi:tetratricopeptide (TPR) repeat protein